MKGVRPPKTACGTAWGALVRAVRLERKETLTAFGAHFGVDHAVVCYWEAGTRKMKFEALVRLASLAPDRNLQRMVIDDMRKRIHSDEMKAVLAEVAE